jgi:Rieske Fe-S protein
MLFRRVYAREGSCVTMLRMEAQEQSSSAQAQRFPAWVPFATLALLAVGVVVTVALLVGRGGDDSVPQGVSASVVDGEPVFIVRDGDDVQVFAADPRHLPDEPLWWCPNEQVFVGPFHGEQFARDGRYIAGPAMGGLNEFLSEIDGDRLTIDTGTVVESDRSDRGEVPPELRNADFGTPWNSGPGSFCDGAVFPPED